MKNGDNCISAGDLILFVGRTESSVEVVTRVKPTWVATVKKLGGSCPYRLKRSRIQPFPDGLITDPSVVGIYRRYR